MLSNIFQLYHGRINFLSLYFKLSHGFIGCCLMHRGDVMPVKVNKAIRTLKDKFDPYFVTWVPNGFKVGINTPQLTHPEDWEYPDCKRSLISIVNSTVMAEKFKHLLSHYRKMTEQQCYNFWFNYCNTLFYKILFDIEY